MSAEDKPHSSPPEPIRGASEELPVPGVPRDKLLARGRDELDAMYVEALAVRSAIPREASGEVTARQLNGTAAALAWVLGKSGRSPVNDHLAFQSHRDGNLLAMRYEIGLARGHARIAADSGDRAYLEGVIAALSWAAGDSARPPC